MKTTKTLMMTAAAVVLSTAAMAEGYISSETQSRYDATRATTANSVDGNISAADDTAERDTNYSDVNPAAGTRASADVNANVAVSNLDTRTIEQIQTSLANEGYSIRADGVWGPKTASALRQFQQANGLAASGMVDTNTLAALEVNTGM